MVASNFQNDCLAIASANRKLGPPAAGDIDAARNFTFGHQGGVGGIQGGVPQRVEFGHHGRRQTAEVAGRFKWQL